jgi:phospho-N-acetylmuramoyl-pentapeptide-transferase
MVRFTEVDTHLAFTRPTTLDLTEVGWVVFAVLLIVGTSNAVNLTDGLDGLAAGAAILCFSAYTVIPFWQFRHPDAFLVDHALDLAVISSSMVGALVGFLWWNAAPARIFMGDTVLLRSVRVSRRWRSPRTPNCCWASSAGSS